LDERPDEAGLIDPGEVDLLEDAVVARALVFYDIQKRLVEP
jgi:hypothetical protein